MRPSDIDDLAIEEVCERVVLLTSDTMAFWKTATGWAPAEAAGLLSRSMLEWQASLAASLPRWIHASEDGDLILAWANLGALVEGMLRLFLCVYYADYQDDEQPMWMSGNVQQPDEASLELLRQFFVSSVWTGEWNWNSYVQFVQLRRNAIHAFRPRDIGTFDEWRAALRIHLAFVCDLNDRLPYPAGGFTPREW
ncbi:MAG: hypothetical protein M1617_04185 [Actinobacteria bacterium]|nr:hypothetical protein [Actinomycetota bacterium]MCL5887490.1 hypothetical protein [Actinomycetota bacterium]